MFGVHEGRDNLFLKWSVESTELNFIEFGSWKATCEQYPNTIGSDLALHRVVSCRGCGVSFWFDVIRGKCHQCPFNYYTTGPYATECVVCPPDSQWGNARKTMIQLCYGRE
ncbi:unnamed protein product [Lymnaea stagnalis]|uniref:Tyrosine-protein kinase ephrin type A/B receptor-like domain-containing protein n=1 Tax=Lymnaea stagnalis TaxID=6523 RepID=A0AAV2I1P8_LYMST